MTEPVSGLQVYLVGGALRDELLGLTVVERDWVVVGADDAMMRAAGFERHDREFPVYLHPDSGEEYALARREVKRGHGYRGFDVDVSPDVTLEEDLRRRDLTINAMARDARGVISDPFNGRQDLDNRLLRHVTPAFVEDPVRVLRVARFAAKLGRFDFRVAHPTQRLLVQMVEQGEMAHLMAERLWREMFSAMATDAPWRFFEVLHLCGALAVLIPEVADAPGETAAHVEPVESAGIAALKHVGRATADPRLRLVAFLSACLNENASVDDLIARLRADRESGRMLRRAVAGAGLLGAVARGDVQALLDLALIWRAFDDNADPEAIALLLEAWSADPRIGRVLRCALPAARAVQAAELDRSGLQGAALGQALTRRRLEAMRQALRAGGLLT